MDNRKYDNYGELIQQPDNSNIIDAGIGCIRYQCDNLQLQQVMEQLQDAFNETSPMEIINRLKG